MQRNEAIQRLQTEEFDLCIIGGGASGAGCALDAALRGLKVALVEKTDFAAETSSRSTKLVHGGVRYLEQAFKKLDFAQLRQVRHGLEERHLVLQNAPHLAHPLGLMTPVFSWWEGLYFSIGLWMYDLFAARKDVLPKSRWLRKKDMLRLMPGLSAKIHSAVLYYDGQLDDARYCLALVQSAANAGAVVANHLEVMHLPKDASGKIKGVNVANRIEGGFFGIRAKHVLNCCGPFADVIRTLANPLLPTRISPSKGVHLVLPLQYFNSKYALLIPKTKDGRMVFAIPFEGNLLLGTTDDPWHDLTHEPMLDASEVAFLLETLQPFMAEKIDKSAVKAGFGGLRPLVSAAKNSSHTSTATKSLLRDHEVEYDPVSGLTSLLGGKWTTYRLMAKDAIDFICRQTQVTTPCQTDEHVLVGAHHWQQDLWKKIAAVYGFATDVSQHLASKYGDQAGKVGQIVLKQPDLGARLLPDYPFIQAEVVHAAQTEMAMSIRDFLARRIRLEFIDWEATRRAIPVVAALLGQTLGWSAQLQQENMEAYEKLIITFQKQADYNE